MNNGMFRYWGKAQPAQTGPDHHLLPYHSLDVAAVGQHLLVSDPDLCSWLTQRTYFETTDLIPMLSWALALHDIGKFSEAFQNLSPDLYTRLSGKTTARPYEMRHDSMGFLAWREQLRPSNRDAAKVLEVMVETTTGHHGQPPNPFDKIGRSLRSLYSDTNLEDLTQFSTQCSDLFQFNVPALSKEQFASLRSTSWWIAGFAILCDWLGSNQKFFPYRDKALALDEYFEDFALPQAKKAVAEVNLLPVRSSNAQPITSLFPFISTPTSDSEVNNG